MNNLVVVYLREGSINSDMGSRASMRDDDIARAEFVVDSARQAVGDLMRKIEQVCTVQHLTAASQQPKNATFNDSFMVVGKP